MPQAAVHNRNPRSILRALFQASRPNRENANLKLSELVEIWVQTSKPRQVTEYRVRIAANTFIGLIGDLLVSNIRRDTLLDFRDMLQCFPKHQLKEEPLHSVGARYERWTHEVVESRVRLSPATVQSKLQLIKGLVRFAYRECWIDHYCLSTLRLGRRCDTRRSFTKAELHQLIAGDLFTRPWPAPHDPSRISPTTIRWLILLALMTGARLEEIGQLQPGDIRKEDQIWAIHISDRDAQGRVTEKQLKNIQSERVVPIHRRLVDLGFLRFAERQREIALWMFDDLKPDRVGKRTHSASCRLARIIDRVSPDPRLVFHSFRHGFKDLCREAGIEDSINDQLTGHAPRTVGRSYGSGVDRRSLADAIARLNFEFIDWEPILRAVSVAP